MLAFPSSSRCPPRPRGIDLKDEIQKNLSHEVRTKYGGEELSDELKAALRDLSEEDRHDVVNSWDLESCTPLFHAARMGNVAMAKYLIETCGADLEVKGTLDTFDDPRPHIATPLWVASVYGGLPMVQYLLSRGANVNSTTNSCSTPVRSACFMSNFAIVQELAESGANILLTNQCGGSCLINAVQSLELCQFLIDRGIEVNWQDIEGCTALHYAVRERRLDATQLLVENGANIFIENCFGMSPLRIAAHKGDKPIFEYMKTIANISYEEEADMLELIGANRLQSAATEAIAYYVQAATLRETHGVRKPRLGYCPPYASLVNPSTGVSYGEVPEYSAAAQWEALADNHSMLQMQALLIKERLLGAHHKDVLKNINSCCESRMTRDNFFYSIGCKSYVFRLYFHKEANGMLCFETAKALQDLVECFQSWKSYHAKMDADGFESAACSYELLMATLKFLIEQLPTVVRQLKCKPYWPRERTCYDVFILACNHLLSILLSDPRSKKELLEISAASDALVRYARPVYSTGDSLLHLAVRNFSSYGKSAPLCLQHIQFLIHFGADVNALNYFQEAPLHILLKKDNYEEDEIAEALVNAGAHLDALDNSNFSPLEKLLEKPFPGFCTSPPLSLQCITAKFVGTMKRSVYEEYLPRHLVDFVTHHSPVATCRQSYVKLYEKLYHYDY